MSKHDHQPPPPACEHPDLKFCRQCDAVECGKCGKEWGAPPKEAKWGDILKVKAKEPLQPERWPWDPPYGPKAFLGGPGPLTARQRPGYVVSLGYQGIHPEDLVRHRHESGE